MRKARGRRGKDGGAGGNARAGLLCCALSLASLCTLWLAPAHEARAHDQFSIQASSQNGAVVLHVQAHLRARYASIWSTLTDYERLPQFVPCISYSRVLERRGATSIIEQKGTTQLLFLSFPIEVTVESVENPPYGISVRVLKGNLKQLEGGYKLARVEGTQDEYLLSWQGVIEPDFSVPPFITVPLLRAALQEQFLAMVKEIERREAALSPAPAPPPSSPVVEAARVP